MISDGKERKGLFWINSHERWIYDDKEQREETDEKAFDYNDIANISISDENKIINSSEINTNHLMRETIFVRDNNYLTVRLKNIAISATIVGIVDWLTEINTIFVSHILMVK